MTTSALPKRDGLRAPAPVPCLKSSLGDMRAARRAGAKPTIKPESRELASANQSSVQSKETSFRRTVSGGAMAQKICTPPTASPIPAKPPSTASRQFGELTRPLWQQIRDQQHSFSGVFAWSVNLRYVGRGSAMRHFHELRVTGDFFRVLGLRPFRGRLLLPEDEGPCPMTRAVVSYPYWLSELGGRDLSSTTKLVVDNELVEIVGVTPPGFFGMAVAAKTGAFRRVRRV